MEPFSQNTYWTPADLIQLKLQEGSPHNQAEQKKEKWGKDLHPWEGAVKEECLLETAFTGQISWDKESALKIQKRV